MARLHELAGAANKGDGDAATALKTNAGLLGLLGQTADQWAKGVVNLGTDFSTSSSMQANIEVVTEEIDRKIARLWRRHGSYLNGIEKMRRQLANAGIKTTDLDINLALKETSVTLKTMGSNEFRHFMWNLISNITTKVLDQARQAA